MIDVNKILKQKGKIIKLVGNAPEGFKLIHEKTLEQLKNPKIWSDWKDGKLQLDDLNKKNFDSENN